MIWIYLYLLAVVGVIWLAIDFTRARWFWTTVALVMTVAPVALVIFVLETLNSSNIRMG